MIHHRAKPRQVRRYAFVLLDDVPAANPTVKVARDFARPDASKVREVADDIRDGKFVLPISRRCTRAPDLSGRRGAASRKALECVD